LADTTPTSGGTTTSFSNTPQAQDDFFAFSITGLTEDTGTVYLSVLANDLGGTAKTLYSVDDGTSTGSTSYSDLLQKDVAAISSDTSAMGAKIWVNADGRVGYSTSGVDRLQQLAAGEVAEDSFIYAIRLGNGTLSWARVVVQVMGTNDQPQILAANSKATGSLTELGSQIALAANNSASGTLAFKDVDLSDTHTAYQGNPVFGWSGGTLSDSQTAALKSASTLALTMTDSTKSGSGSVGWNYSANDMAFDFLGKNQTLTVTYQVSVADNHGGTASQNVVITVTGTNDAVGITSGAQAGSVIEDSATAHM